MRLFLLLIVVFSTGLTYSQCNSDSNKIIVIGDSWAFFSWTYDSYNENLDKYGMTDVKAYSDTGLSVNGTQADNYFNPSYRKSNLITALNDYPEAEIVHMSLGGNDFLGGWNKNMSVSQADSVINEIIYNARRDVDTIHSINPNLSVYIPGYDYPNFVETAALVGSSHPFHDVWTDMAQPSVTELNTFVWRYSQIFMDSIATWDNVYMVNNVGLMQWHYGQTSPLLVFPFSTYSPMSVPLPGGDIDMPSPLDAMGVGGVDSFHLRDGAYEVFIERMIRLFYWRKLRKADASIYANETKSGTIYSDGTVALTEVKLGNTSNLSAKGILSFNTTVLDETKTIAKASVFIKRKNLNGVNPIAETLQLGIKNGSYGASDLIDGDEYAAISDAEASACTYGTITQNNYWMRIDLPETLLPYINSVGETQLKMEYLFADLNRNIDYFNDIDTSNQVVLDIVYGDPVSVTEQFLKNKGLHVYPNPVNDVLSISFDELHSGEIEIYSMLGRKVLMNEIQETKQINIDVSELPQGTYLVSFSNNGKLRSKKIVILK